MFSGDLKEVSLPGNSGGMFEVVHSFKIWSIEGKGKKAFTSKTDAQNLLAQVKHDYLFLLLTKFMDLISLSRDAGSYYNTPGKKKSFEKVEFTIEYCKTKKIHEAVNLIMVAENDLRNILPSERNQYYRKCYELLIEIIIFCRKEK